LCFFINKKAVISIISQLRPIILYLLLILLMIL